MKSREEQMLIPAAAEIFEIKEMKDGMRLRLMFCRALLLRLGAAAAEARGCCC